MSKRETRERARIELEKLLAFYK